MQSQNTPEQTNILRSCEACFRKNKIKLLPDKKTTKNKRCKSSETGNESSIESFFLFHMKAEHLKSLQVKRVLKIQQAIAAVVRSFLSALLFTRYTLKNI